MSFFAYILRCSDGHYYVGHTDNLETRIAKHNSGEISGYTQKRLPVELVWSENFPSREEAFAAERQVKGWSRAKKEALIKGNWSEMSERARKPVLRDGSAAAHPEEGLSYGEDPSRRTPLIILVRPQLGENIGKAARAMLNFGLSELRLVAPRDGWPNPSAGPAAAGADMVLERAQVFDTLAGAIADCEHVYATTVRKRGVAKPVITPEEAAAAIRQAPGRSAILFGPERAGLESDDVAVARSIITVPINPDFGSLNLAQAVILIAYEWSKHAPSEAEGGAEMASPPRTDLDPPAPQGELDGMINQFDDMLEAAGHFFPPDRAHIDKRTIRSLLTKPGWSAQEVRTLRGMLRSLGDPHPRAL
jgi:tRNA/rRNA methyltransferase